MPFVKQQGQGVTFFTSDMLESRHAFSTRHGGVSALPHTASMNLAFGRGDGEDTVRENLGIFCRAVGVDPHTVVSVPQIHSARVYEIDKTHAGEGYFSPASFDGDGYVTACRGVTPGVKSADCVPILLEARARGQVVAVGAVHAGWRGSVAGIAGVCARRLTEVALRETAEAPVDVYAAIGPCIGACCYEVGADCLAHVADALGDGGEACVQRRDGRTYLDLVELNRRMLVRAGVCLNRIDVAGLCTCCQSDLFYSHRATGGKRGTMLALITL